MPRFMSSLVALTVLTIMPLLSIPTALAHAHHTANFCSATAADVCAHLGFNAEPNSTSEAIFMLDFAPSKIDPALITNVTVKLVMDMNGTSHSARPVIIKAVNAAHYEVSKVYFSMTGPWIVKAGFDYLGSSHEVIIPIDVK